MLRTGGGKGLAEIDGKIAHASLQRELTEEQIRLANPRYGALTHPKPATLTDIQSLLDDETVLLEYSLGPDRSNLFAVSKSQLLSFELPSRRQIDKLAKQAHDSCSKPKWTAEAESISQELSDTVLGPAANFIKGHHHRLLIVADGSLQYIPFCALPMPKKSGDLGTVASQFEVTYSPSASLLLRLRNHPSVKSKGSIALIGDPVFTKDDSRVVGGSQFVRTASTATRGTDDSNPAAPEDVLPLIDDDGAMRGVELTRLIHSREEVEAIASVSTRDHPLTALDFDANRALVFDPRVAKSRIVHFATHGIFDSKNPAMSGLVLSLVDRQGKPQTGFLGLDDIYRLHYSVDLVVLSGCETALGEQIDGEGMVGLTWGFIYAGAKSVVSSLWRVNDASTAELMRLFYSGMEQQGLTPAAALRQAQLNVSHRPAWSSPYYWAGFVIEGQYAK